MLQLKLLKGGLDNDTLGSLSPQQFEAFLPTSAAALRLLHLQRPALSDAAYLSPDLHHRRGGSGETNITSVLTEVLNPPKEPHFHCRGHFKVHTNSGRPTLFQTDRLWNYAYRSHPITYSVPWSIHTPHKMHESKLSKYLSETGPRSQLAIRRTH
jgi:hypothetical protein